MSELPASLQEALNELEREHCTCGAGLDRMKPSTWEHCGIHRRTEALLPVFEAQVEAAEEAGFAEGFNWVEDGKSNNGKGALARHDAEVRDKALEEAADECDGAQIEARPRYANAHSVTVEQLQWWNEKICEVGDKIRALKARTP